MPTNKEWGLWTRWLWEGLVGLGGKSLADELPVWFGAKRVGETRVCRNRVTKCWRGDPVVSVLGCGAVFIAIYNNIYIALLYKAYFINTYYIKLYYFPWYHYSFWSNFIAPGWWAQLNLSYCHTTKVNWDWWNGGSGTPAGWMMSNSKLRPADYMELPAGCHRLST